MTGIPDVTNGTFGDLILKRDYLDMTETCNYLLLFGTNILHQTFFVAQLYDECIN